MAKVGELERIVDNLVGRGLVAPKFVGRQVGQALIDELANLPDALATSQATRQSESTRRLADFQSQLLRNTPSNVGNVRPSKTSSTSPIALGISTGNTFRPNKLAVALPSSDGFSVQSINTNDPLAKLALKTSPRIPQLDTVFSPSTYKSLQDIQNTLLKNPGNQVTGVLDRFKSIGLQNG